MKTPPIVYGLVSLCILVGVIFFVSHERALAPTNDVPVVVVPVDPKPVQPTVSAYGTVSAKLGSTIQFADFSLTPLSVESDSRCPVDVTCVWAGTLTVKTNFVNGAGTTTKVIEIGKPTSYGSFTITLVSSSPTPNSQSSIGQSDYRFVFSVIKKAPTATVPPAGKCYVGGCSSQLCSDQPNMVSTCIYRSEFACYKTAQCERQSSGQCGWTPTNALNMCVKNAQASPSSDSPQ